MIKRHYILCVEKPYNDGSSSYSWHSFLMDYSSWFADPDKVYKDAHERMVSMLKDKPGNELKTICFNRI